ncbi:MAG: cache domain-containing protein, partial [Acholeplasmataceae bacterium]|nr:cache domain-containing protein [Acholeplasmataceae bacterium]
MRNLIRNPYIIGFLFLLPFSLAFVLFHVYTMNVTRNNLETIVELEQEHLKSEVSSYFNGIGRTLQTLTGHLEIYGTEGFLSSLVAATEQNPAIASIYYLDIDNNMINSSGYVPDPEIDFRTRPWYLSAVAANDLAYTSAFLNATGDKIIVSMSMPVHDQDEVMIGVLSADIDTRSITEHISSQTVLENGFGVLIDDDGYILASPTAMDTLTLRHVEDIVDEGSVLLSSVGMQTVVFDGIHGVMFMSDVLDGTYHLGIFIPMDEYNTETAMMFNIFAFLSFLIVTVWASTAFMYRKHMVEPIEHLAYDVSLININNESHYQLPVTKNDLFSDVRKTINRVIEDNDRHITTIKEQMVALKELAT